MIILISHNKGYFRNVLFCYDEQYIECFHNASGEGYVLYDMSGFSLPAAVDSPGGPKTANFTTNNNRPLTLFYWYMAEVEGYFL